jgi:hypothetical protein
MAGGHSSPALQKLQLLGAATASLLLRLVLLLFLLLGIVMADRAARGSTDLAMSGHMTGDAADDRAGDAACLGGCGGNSDCEYGGEQITHDGLLCCHANAQVPLPGSGSRLCRRRVTMTGAP